MITGEFDAERSLSYEAFTRPKFHYDCILVHTINDWRAAWANGTGGVLVNPEPAVGIVQVNNIVSQHVYIYIKNIVGTFIVCSAVFLSML